ncbi:MAG: hypothetical protein HYV93_13975 [Candidatus Rokubacteria bacterium]|nr:hypothetical protein [Candidatus Rokubacteria bacterium]
MSTDTLRARGIAFYYLVARAEATWPASHHGFDPLVTADLPSLRPWAPWWHPIGNMRWRWSRWRRLPTVYRYEDVEADLLPPRRPGVRSHPCLLPNWDNTPRSAANGL